MDQPAATSAEAAPVKAPDVAQPNEPDVAAPADADQQTKPLGFRARGGVRRRVRYLRKARELAYRDLGGLVFDLHRFGQRNDPLVIAKLTTLGQIDTELRALEASLGEGRPMTVLREAGITACPRCAAIHSGEDRFCPRCGLPVSRNVDLPVAGAAGPSTAAPASAVPGSAATAPPAAAPPSAAPAPAAPPAAAPGSGAQPSAAPPATPPAGPAAPPAAAEPATRVHPQSAPAQPAPSQPAPATSAPTVVKAPVGPSEPQRAGPSKGTKRESAEEPTEILRPPATGK